jgi:hypothetical protein
MLGLHDLWRQRGWVEVEWEGFFCFVLYSTLWGFVVCIWCLMDAWWWKLSISHKRTVI